MVRSLSCFEHPPTRPLGVVSLPLKDTLAARHPGNPLLQVRGNAGTHDLDLGLETIRALKQQQQQPAKKLAKEDVDDGNSDGDDDDAGEEIKVVACIPRYNKSAGEGRGDRTPREDWVEVSTPPELVLLEGWMLGFEALPEDSPVLAQADRGDACVTGGTGGSGAEAILTR